MVSIIRATALCAAVFLPLLALADTIGEQEYLGACASCHGTDASGNGPLSEILTIDAPPLTGLSAGNDGVFPMLEVIHIIDGRTGVRGHGSSMPVWGAIYRNEIGESRGTYGSEVDIRGRVLSLAYYLESIQE